MSQKTIINLFRVWTMTAIACFCLMLLHQSDSPTFFGSYSTSYTLSLIIMLTTLIMALIGWFLAERNQLNRLLPSSKWPLSRLVALLCLLFIALFWIFMPGAIHLPAIALFRIYIMMIATGIALFYLYQIGENQSELNPRIWQILLIAGIALACVITFLFIGKVPASLYFDEPLVANYAWTCAEEGIPGVRMLPPRDTAYIRLTLPISYCIPGFLMKWFGSTLTVARMSGIILLWIATPFVYFTAKRLYSAQSAVIATLVMLFFALMHNHLRSDPYVTLALSIALFAYIRAKDKPGLWQHFTVGFFLATIIEGHQLGIRFIPIFILLYLWQYIGVIREQKRFVFYAPFFAFAIGGLSYLPIFYLIHIVLWAKTDIPGAIELINFAYEEQLAVGGNVGFWQRISDNLEYWFLRYPIHHPIEVMLLFVGLISAIWRKQASDRLLLFVFILSFILYIYITPKPTVYYWVHHLPIIALLSAGFLQSIIQNRETRLVSIFPILVLMTFFLSQMTLATRPSQSADRVMEISFDIDENLPPELDVITGHQVYFWGLSGRTFYDSNTYSKLSIPEASAEYNINPPQAVVLSRGLDEHPRIRSYIEEENMIPVRCYPTNFFGRQTILYVLPEFVESIPEQSCP